MFGDVVRIEALIGQRNSITGTIDNRVLQQIALSFERWVHSQPVVSIKSKYTVGR